MNLSTLFRASAPLFLPPPHSNSPSRTNATENIAIEGRNLNYSITTRQGKIVPILQDCSLRIPSGQFWMLLGPNGCGKSTLLKILAGLLNPTNGAVRVKGPKSYVFQNPDHQHSDEKLAGNNGNAHTWFPHKCEVWNFSTARIALRRN